MLASSLITFRETLEAALVVGIILAFLARTAKQSLKKYVWYGVGGGIVASVIIAALLQIFFGGLEGRLKQIFEGILMFVTSSLLTTMILWIHRQKGIAKRLEKGTGEYIKRGFPVGISFLVFTSVMREGIETVFYLQAISSLGATNQAVGSLVGIVSAILLSYSLFKFSLKINLQSVLKISGAVLLLFAAGLVSHGVHEFQEAGLLPIFHFDPLIDISQILDNTSVFGSILRTLFGYTATPTFLEIIMYVGYILFIFLLEVWTDRVIFSRSEEK